MTSRNPGRLAIHRRSDELAFLQQRLRTLAHDNRLRRGVAEDALELELEASMRERDLADELLHTRQFEPLGETLQRRLAMAERICRDLVSRVESGSSSRQAFQDNERTDRYGEQKAGAASADIYPDQDENVAPADLPDAYRVAEIERRALTEMLKQWWAWLGRS